MTSTYRIIVQVDSTQAATGARQVKRELDSIGQSADRLRNLISQAFTFFGVTYGIREIFKLADAYTNLQNRVRTVTRTQEEAVVVTNELYKISQLTRTSFTATAEVYTRTASATKSLGLSQRELLSFMTTLNQAVAVSGATSQEASNALIQLSQGMASGALRGEELRSVLEQLPRVADLIAQKMGIVNRGALRDLAAQGKLTTKTVFEAVTEAREQVAEEFARSVPTISQGFIVLQNAATKFFGDLSKSKGVGEGFANLLIYISENMDTFGRVALAVGAVLAASLVSGGIALVVAALGSLPAILLLAGSLLVAFSDKIVVGANGFTTLADYAVTAFDLISEGVDALIENFHLEGIVLLFEETFDEVNFSVEGVLRFGAAVADTYLGIWIGLGKGIVAAVEGIPDAFRDIFTRAMNGIIELVESGLNQVTGVISNVTEFAGLGRIAPSSLNRITNTAEGAAGQIGSNIKAAFLAGINQDAISTGLDTFIDKATETANKRIAEQKEKDRKLQEAEGLLGQKGRELPQDPANKKKGADKKTFDDYLNQLKSEAVLLGLNSQQREIYTQVLQIENSLKRDLTTQEVSLLVNQLKINQALQDQADLLDEIRSPAETFDRQLKALNELYSQGKIGIEDYTQALRGLQLSALETGRDMESGLSRGLLTIAEEFGNVANVAADTVVNAFGSAEDALVKFISTGKLGFKDLVSSITQDIARLTIRANLTAPIANYLGSILSGPTGAGGSGASQSSGAVSSIGTQALTSAATSAAFAGAGSAINAFGAKYLSTGFGNFVGPAAPGLGGASLTGILGAGGIGFAAGGLLGPLLGLNKTGSSFGAGGGAALGFALSGGNPLGALAGGAIGGLAGGTLGKLFGGKPSDKTAAGELELNDPNFINRTGATSGKKFSAENTSVRESVIAFTQSLSAQLAEVVGTTVDRNLQVKIGNRDGSSYIIEGESRQSFKNAADLVKALTGDLTRLYSVGGQGKEAIANLNTAIKNIDFTDTAKALSDIQFALNFDKLGQIQKPINQLETQLKALNKVFDEAASTAERLGLAVAKVRDAQAEAVRRFVATTNQSVYDEILAITNPKQLDQRAEINRFDQQLREVKSINGDIQAVYELHRIRMLQINQQYNGEEESALKENAVTARKTADAYRQLSASLTQAIQGLRLGNLSTLSPEQKLDEARQLFDSTLSKALSGDQEAAGQLASLGQTVLELSQGQNRSDTEFAADFNKVQEGLTAARDYAVQQVNLQQRIADGIDSGFKAVVAALQTGGGSAGSAGYTTNSLGQKVSKDNFNEAVIKFIGTSNGARYSQELDQLLYALLPNIKPGGGTRSAALEQNRDLNALGYQLARERGINILPAYATGTESTLTTMPFWVGERGPEIMSVQSAHRVTPVNDNAIMKVNTAITDSNRHLSASVRVMTDGFKELKKQAESTSRNTRELVQATSLQSRRKTVGAK